MKWEQTQKEKNVFSLLIKLINGMLFWAKWADFDVMLLFEEAFVVSCTCWKGLKRKNMIV